MIVSSSITLKTTKTFFTDRQQVNLVSFEIGILIAYFKHPRLLSTYTKAGSNLLMMGTFHSFFSARFTDWDSLEGEQKMILLCWEMQFLCITSFEKKR